MKRLQRTIWQRAKKICKYCLKKCRPGLLSIRTSPDQKHTAPGHEVVEMGLVKLYRITGEKKYLNTAKYFIEERGHDVSYDSTSTDEWKNGSYWQDNIPVDATNRSSWPCSACGLLIFCNGRCSSSYGRFAFRKCS